MTYIDLWVASIVLLLFFLVGTGLMRNQMETKCHRNLVCGAMVLFSLALALSTAKADNASLTHRPIGCDGGVHTVEVSIGQDDTADSAVLYAALSSWYGRCPPLPAVTAPPESGPYKRARSPHGIILPELPLGQCWTPIESGICVAALVYAADEPAYWTRPATWIRWERCEIPHDVLAQP